MCAARRSTEQELAETTRGERLDRIRREIADGTYETEEKLAAAIAAMSEQISRQEDSAVGVSPKHPK